MKKQYVSWAAFAALLLSGCIHYDAKNTHSGRPLPADYHVLTQSNGYEREVFGIDVESNKTYTVTIFNLVTPTIAPNTNRKELELECYFPRRPTNAPVVMILPVSGGGYFLERYFARYFVKKGFGAVIVYREKERIPSAPDEMNAMLAQSVADGSRVIDWIETRSEFDPTRVVVLGTSMGAIKASLLVAVDGRIKGAVLGLVGGDIPYILRYSMEPGVVHRREMYLSSHNMTAAEFEKKLRENLVWDPLKLAPCVPTKKVMLILGFFDTAIPYKKGNELRKAMGKPETNIVPSGHYSAFLYLPYIRWRTRVFLEDRIKYVPPTVVHK